MEWRWVFDGETDAGRTGDGLVGVEVAGAAATAAVAGPAPPPAVPAVADGVDGAGLMLPTLPVPPPPPPLPAPAVGDGPVAEAGLSGAVSAVSLAGVEPGTASGSVSPPPNREAAGDDSVITIAPLTAITRSTKGKEKRPVITRVVRACDDARAEMKRNISFDSTTPKRAGENVKMICHFVISVLI